MVLYQLAEMSKAVCVKSFIAYCLA